MKAGKAKTGEAIDLATVFEGVGKVSAGTMSLSQLQDIEENACPTCGSCSGMGFSLAETENLERPFLLSRAPEKGHLEPF